MPFASHQGVRLYWRLQGSEGKPVLGFLHGIGADQTLFDAIVPLLIDDFRLLRVDLRGHGASDASDGDYSMDLLAGDVLAVLDAAGLEKVMLCGVSLGGMVAMELALKAPDRPSGLILACTSARFEPGFWDQRVAVVRAGGTAAIAAAAVGKVMTEAFAQAHSALVDSARFALEHMDPRGYAGCGAAIRDMDLLARLSDLELQVLLLAGTADGATPFEGHGDRIAAALSRARTMILPTGHWACVEEPALFAAAVRSFAEQVGQGAVH
jgi:3-oxoadipate enol-lactonase/4-carboxymuconolactone decarboxylase